VVSGGVAVAHVPSIVMRHSRVDLSYEPRIVVNGIARLSLNSRAMLPVCLPL
jgi:hypothetical protein